MGRGAKQLAGSPVPYFELRPLMTSDSGRAALEAQLREDLAATSYPQVDWVRPIAEVDGATALDCAVIGAGQMGLTIAAFLKREGVTRTALFDAADPGREGPWETFARMRMLRTPKFLTGLELGVPSLGFRAWWIATRGRQAWEEMTRIPREAWMEYLRWYREIMELDVRNGHRAVAVTPVWDGLFRLDFETPDGARVVYARTVVLATGTEGGGGRIMPPAVAALPGHLRAHTNDLINVAALKGKRIGVLGGGASGFDLAIAALEAGAVSADLCVRRHRMPDENPRRWMETPGFLAHYGSLPDARKWAYLRRLYAIGQPPPLPTSERAHALPGFRLHLGTDWDSCESRNGEAVDVTSGERHFTFDYVVAATGIATDLALRTELAVILDRIALWSDRFTPDPELAHPVLSRFPYLGQNGEFTPKCPDDASWLSRLFFVARSSTLSLGPVAASNSALKYIAPLVGRGVLRTLLLDQAEADWKAFTSIKHFEQPATTRTA